MANFSNSFIQSKNPSYSTQAENPLLYKLNYLNLIGDVTGIAANGIVITTLADTGVASGTYSKVSVNTKGQVTNGSMVTASEIGLGNVNNTSDLNKPISDITLAALNLKADKINEGKVLGGQEVVISNISSGDVLIFSDGKWINSTKLNLTDGGNF